MFDDGVTWLSEQPVLGSYKKKTTMKKKPACAPTRAATAVGWDNKAHSRVYHTERTKYIKAARARGQDIDDDKMKAHLKAKCKEAKMKFLASV